MPHEQVVDHANRLVVIRFFGEGTLEDLSDAARCLLQDQSIGTGYGLMLVGDDYALYPTLDDLLNIVSFLKAVRCQFTGRIAIVTARPGQVTTALLVAISADTESKSVRSFVSESKARAWLLGSTEK
jgi:hypothetical protein